MRRIFTGLYSGAMWGAALGVAIAAVLLIASFLSGESVVPKWKMAVVDVAVAYILGFTLSGCVAGAFTPFASSRLRAYAIGTLAALPFAIVVAASYLGPDRAPTTYLIPALIWAAVVGGAVGLVMYSLRS
jgi:hypothetical protein